MTVDAGAPHTVSVQDSEVRDLASQLQDRPLFVGLNPAEMEELIRLTEPCAFAAGDVVVREGEPGDALYLLVEGSVRVEKDGRTLSTLYGGDSITLGYEGDFFGEMSLVDIEPRSATVVAVEPVRGLRLKRETLLPYLHRNRDVHLVLLTNIARILSRRLRMAGRR